MNTTPKITFAIPFFTQDSTGLEYLKLTLESVLAQTDVNWVAFVNDDCSPYSGAKELVESFKDSRISYFQNEKNLGQAGNWNSCMNRVKTDFVVLLHADDELKPSFMARMLDHLSNHPSADAIFCGADIIDSQGQKRQTMVDLVKTLMFPKKWFHLKGEEGLIEIMRGNFIFCPTLCYRTKSAVQIPFDTTWRTIPDWSHWADMLIAGQVLIGTSERLFRYRRHEASGTGIERKRIKLFEEETAFCKSVSERSAQLGWNKAADKARSMTIVRARLVYFAVSDLMAGRPAAAWEKFKFLQKLAQT